MSLAKKIIAMVGLAAACFTAGCAGGAPAGQADETLDPGIAALVEANRSYPQWSAFPAEPSDIPTDAAMAARVSTLKVSAGTLAGEASRIQWLLDNADAYEAGVRSRLARIPVSPDAAATSVEIEAFQQRLRDRGRAPPPVDRPR
ncbi:hypothetical protein GVN24_25440 [Rhizobium sp. CRIBSB]|nr:hypothetical protein [Rhizobium sp. CRIBSB]